MTLQQLLSALIVVVIAGIAAWLMIWGWRRRVRRQQDVAALPERPAELSGAEPIRAKYVATTRADRPYDRLAVRGLAFRGSAAARVHAEGILIERDGETAIWIPRARLVRVDRATWTIDRAVERDGLHVLRWQLGDLEVDTYLRVDDPRAFDQAVARTLPTTGAAA